MYKQQLNKFWQMLVSYKKYLLGTGLIFILLSIVKVFTFSASDNLSDSAYEDYFNTNYKVFNIRIPKNLNFAGEKTPIRDFSVREAIERELVVNTYWQSQSLLLHKRANRWFPIIEPILKKHGIPEDFKYIALIESQLTNVISPRGATGFWQLIESTATGYGMEVNDEIDERYHVEKSTEAACKYFKEAYKIFHNWTLVAASYNLGMGGIQNQLKKQKVKSYYDLLLNEETGRYVYRILAMKEIIGRPKVYGYTLRKKDLYYPIPVKKLVVDSSIDNLTDFALIHGINYKILKVFNPWLKANTLTNLSHKKYIIEIPKETQIYSMQDEYEDEADNTTLVKPSSLTDSSKFTAQSSLPKASPDKQ